MAMTSVRATNNGVSRSGTSTRSMDSEKVYFGIKVSCFDFVYDVKMHRAAVAVVASRPRAAPPASPRVAAPRSPRFCAVNSTASPASPMPGSVGDFREAPESGADRKSFALHHPSHRESLIRQGFDVRVVHMVRHAQGTHNVERNGIGLKDPVNFDARLTDVGENQCHALAQSSAIKTISPDIQLVVTSPLSRCCQTALLCFPGVANGKHSMGVKNKTRVPFIAHSGIRETVNFRCDARRLKSELTIEFPRIDFDVPGTEVDEHDTLWLKYDAILGDTYPLEEHRESCDLVSVADRGRDFFQWLGTRGETEVAVSSHSAFMRCLFSWGHEGGVRAAPRQTLSHISGCSSDRDASIPVVTYGGDRDFANQMRQDWENCELRTFLVAYYREVEVVAREHRDRR